MFLTPEQLRELTGYVKPSKQAEWLTRNGVPFFVNAGGRVIVRADAMDKKAVTPYALGTVR